MSDLRLNLEPCLKGSHPYEVLAHIEMVGARGDAAVRWCPVCGAVVIDVERNRKITRPGGISRDRIPEITRVTLGLTRSS